MTDPKKPEITTEFVGVVKWSYVILALAVGLALGAAMLYVFTERVPQGDADHA